MLSLRHFGLVLFIPWRVGAEEAGAAKDAIMAYGFGGAVADFVLVISGSRRRPRRSQVRGQLRHDPIATAGWGGRASLSFP